MWWGEYLAHGIPKSSSDHFLWSNVISGTNVNFAKQLQSNGYAVVHLDNLPDIENSNNWTLIFPPAFTAFTENEKIKLGKYKLEKGVTVGYRSENGREFFETRVDNEGCAHPCSPVPQFSDIVSALYRTLSLVAGASLCCISQSIGIDRDYLLDLTDRGVPAEHELSSSVLRICYYPQCSPSSGGSALSFGAHTDTSFLTIAPLASIPGALYPHPSPCTTLLHSTLI